MAGNIVKHYDLAEMVGDVGAKSKYEPTFKAPEFGWTHTSDWVALELTDDAAVSFEVSRQQGVTGFTQDAETKAVTVYTAGNMFYPGISLYQNWEEDATTTEAMSFNPMGNPSWTRDLKYIGIEYAENGEDTITYNVVLPKGKYSLNIGGVNALYCQPDDPCYVGSHGFKLKIMATHPPMMYSTK